MSESRKPTILCIASFFKGNEFIRECKRQNANVVLLTREKLLTSEWARESLDELIAVPEATLDAYLAAASYVARRWRITNVVALEEYDIVTAAQIREHFCLSGLSSTNARYFQDKLAMRDKARSTNIPQADFVPLFNYQEIEEFLMRVPPPWMLKPRIGASAMGIKQLREREELWQTLAQLDQREAFHETTPFYLLEQYIPGDVYHVDSLVDKGKIVFANVGHYCSAPFEISHFGGVNVAHTVKRGSPEEVGLLALNKKVLNRFGFERGVTHAEFIRRSATQAHNGNMCSANISPSRAKHSQFYFLEAAARVGGAFTAEMIEGATNINPWREWARLELATPEHPYSLPPLRADYGGIAVSLARQEEPDTAIYTDPEIVYRIRKPWHVGLIIGSPDYQRLMSLLEYYRQSMGDKFSAVAPPEEKPRQYV